MSDSAESPKAFEFDDYFEPVSDLTNRSKSELYKGAILGSYYRRTSEQVPPFEMPAGTVIHVTRQNGGYFQLKQPLLVTKVQKVDYNASVIILPNGSMCYIPSEVLPMPRRLMKEQVSVADSPAEVVTPHARLTEFLSGLDHAES